MTHRYIGTKEITAHLLEKDGKLGYGVVWNATGQWVTLIPAGNAMHLSYPMQDCLGLKTSREEMQPGWVPSVSDLLASDWRVLRG